MTATRGTNLGDGRARQWMLVGRDGRGELITGTLEHAQKVAGSRSVSLQGLGDASFFEQPAETTRMIYMNRQFGIPLRND